MNIEFYRSRKYNYLPRKLLIALMLIIYSDCKCTSRLSKLKGHFLCKIATKISNGQNGIRKHMTATLFFLLLYYKGELFLKVQHKDKKICQPQLLYKSTEAEDKAKCLKVVTWSLINIAAEVRKQIIEKAYKSNIVLNILEIFSI